MNHYTEAYIQRMLSFVDSGMAIDKAVKAAGFNYSNSVDRRPEIVTRLREARANFKVKKFETKFSRGPMTVTVERTPLPVTVPKVTNGRGVVRYVMTELMYQMYGDGSYEAIRDEYISKTKLAKEQQEQLKKAADIVFDVMRRV